MITAVIPLIGIIFGGRNGRTMEWTKRERH